MKTAIIAYAEGSPCPTLVVAAEGLLEPREELVDELRPVRRWLRTNGHEGILKIALIGRPASARFDLAYRFVQCLPHDDGAFELAGSCGHSILAAVVAAPQLGLARTGQSLRVHVRNNDDEVVCVPEDKAHYTVSFRRRHAPALPTLSLFETPVIEIDNAMVSGVSFANPYVFVDAAALGWRSAPDLFAAGAELFQRLTSIRTACEFRLGWWPGTFPKVAAVLDAGGGAIAVRAISVPSWHPTLALTGVMCLTAASVMPGTIPASIAAGATPLRIQTAHSATAAQARVEDDRLVSVTAAGRRVRILEQIAIPWVPAHV